MEGVVVELNTDVSGRITGSSSGGENGGRRGRGGVETDQAGRKIDRGRKKRRTGENRS